MKKTITFSIGALSTLMVSAQLPVSHVAGKKQVLIEEFTGNTCPNCPSGHKISDQITAANPGKAFAVNIHPPLINSYTPPAGSSNSLDFRAADGDVILSIPNMIGDQNNGSFGVPAGAINRMDPVSPAAPMCATGFVMSRSYWSSMVNTVLSQNSYVNIAGQAYLHPTTRQLIVNLEAYYTANSPAASNRINIDLIQDDIIAYQSGASQYTAMQVGSGYRHNHALRDVINGGSNGGGTGETMTGPNTAGTTWSKTFTYTVAPTYGTVASKSIPAVLADLEIIAFITEYTASTVKNISAVCKVPITITTSTAIFEPNATTDLISFASVYPNPMANEGAVVFTLAQPSPVTINVVNELGQTVISENLTQLGIGEHKYELDATHLTNGIYLVNIQVDKNTVTKKISVLK